MFHAHVVVQPDQKKKNVTLVFAIPLNWYKHWCANKYFIITKHKYSKLCSYRTKHEQIVNVMSILLNCNTFKWPMLSNVYRTTKWFYYRQVIKISLHAQVEIKFFIYPFRCSCNAFSTSQKQAKYIFMTLCEKVPLYFLKEAKP